MIDSPYIFPRLYTIESTVNALHTFNIYIKTIDIHIKDIAIDTKHRCELKCQYDGLKFHMEFVLGVRQKEG